MGVGAEAIEIVLRDEALHLELVVGAPMRHVGEGLRRRAIAGQLEKPAEQDRHVLEPHAGAPFDVREDLVHEVGVRAAEVEQELRADRFNGRPPRR